MRFIRLLLFAIHVLLAYAPALDILDLDLLETVLEIGSKGQSMERIGRICRAITRGTKAAHPSIQEIAALERGCHFERNLHRWAICSGFL